MDRGIAGFRVDVAHGIVKDRELRDNPPATEDDTHHHRSLGQRLEYSMNRDEVHDVFRRWRSVTDPYDAVLLGETWVLDLERLMRFYGDDLDELHLAFNFVFLLATSGHSSWRRSWPRPRGCCPSTRGRRGRSATTTWSASRRAGRAGTPACRAARS